jgi:hypothetical integral membrane protein (TIGR02206 family)
VDIISKKPITIEPFKLFGFYHIATTVFMAVVLLYVIHLVSKGRIKKKNFRLFMLISLLVLDIAYRVWGGFYETRNLSIFFSLHLSSTSVLLSILLWIKFNQKLYDVLFYWAILLVPQAIITPGIYRYGFPHLRFFHILWIHFLVIATVYYFSKVEKKWPSPLSLKRVVVYTHVYGLFIFIINILFGTNYMFIGKSTNLSIIQFLPPWPYFVLILDLIVCILFALLYKFYIKRK